MSNEDNIIGQNIRRLRKEHHYTQKDLAELIDVKPTTVASWEQGRNKPLMDKVTKLAHLFDVSLTEIAGNNYLSSTNSSTTVADLSSPILALDGHKITGEEAEDIKRYAAFLLQQRKEKEQKNTNSDD